jgi:hypothetical protein
MKQGAPGRETGTCFKENPHGYWLETSEARKTGFFNFNRLPDVRGVGGAAFLQTGQQQQAWAGGRKCHQICE